MSIAYMLVYAHFTCLFLYMLSQFAASFPIIIIFSIQRGDSTSSQKKKPDVTVYYIHSGILML